MTIRRIKFPSPSYSESLPFAHDRSSHGSNHTSTLTFSMTDQSSVVV